VYLAVQPLLAVMGNHAVDETATSVD
jgi:hypothetical protein